jgi:hypothetical protein
VDLDEILRVEEFTEELADTRLESEDRLVGGESHIDDSVIEADVLLDDWHLVVSSVSTSSHLEGLIEDLTRGINELEGKLSSGLTEAPNLVNLEFHLDAASLDLAVWLGWGTNNLNDRLGCDLLCELNHACTDLWLVAGEHDALDGVIPISHDEEDSLGSSLSRVIKSATNTDLLTGHLLVHIGNFDVFLGKSHFWVAGGLVHRKVTELVCAWVIWVLDKLVGLGDGCVSLVNSCLLLSCLLGLGNILLAEFLLSVFRWGSLWSWDWLLVLLGLLLGWLLLLLLLGFLGGLGLLCWLGFLLDWGCGLGWSRLGKDLFGPLVVSDETVPRERVRVHGHSWSIVSHGLECGLIGVTAFSTAEPLLGSECFFELVNHLFVLGVFSSVKFSARVIPQRSVFQL